MKKLTCYENLNESNILCQKCNCKHWIDLPTGLNCVIVSSKKKKMTFEDIGKIFGLTRMRICQIEKKAIHKIKQIISRQSSLTNEL